MCPSACLITFAFIQPALPVAPKHTRGKSSGGNGWLAHHPNTTVTTGKNLYCVVCKFYFSHCVENVSFTMFDDLLCVGTIMQPCIKPGKIVSVPSPKDIKNADKYLLTHQKEDIEGEIETQLIKVNSHSLYLHQGFRVVLKELTFQFLENISDFTEV